MKAFMLAPVLALGLGLAACGENNVAEQAQEAAAQAKAAAAVAKSVAGTVSGIGLNKGDLPDFVVSPEGATLVNRLSMGEAGGNVAGSASFTVPQEADAVVKFYRDHFAKEGYAIKMENATAEGMMLVAERETPTASLTAVIGAGETAGTTSLNLIFAAPKEKAEG